MGGAATRWRGAGLRCGGLLCAGLLSSCLTPGKAEPVRTYRPLVGEAARVAGTGASLRLRPVEGTAHLKQQMVVAASPVEYRFDEFDRWAELPEVYLERELARALFESGAFTRCERTDCPSLTVELRSFEALREGRPRAEVRFGARGALGSGPALFEREYAASEPLDGEGPEALARAIGPAMRSAIQALLADLQVAFPGGDGSSAP